MTIVVVTSDFDPVLQEDIQAAVRNYTSGPGLPAYDYTVAKYGTISEWNTFQVTDTSYLFLNQLTFNEIVVFRT